MVRKCGAWSGVVDSKRWGPIVVSSHCNKYATCPRCRRAKAFALLERINWIRQNFPETIILACTKEDARKVSTAILQSGADQPQAYWYKLSISTEHVILFYLPVSKVEWMDEAASEPWPTQQQIEAAVSALKKGGRHSSSGQLGALI